MTGPGPRNSITDVPGITVGNAEDHDLLTGVSVVLPDEPAVAAVDVRGGGPGTRETEALGAFSTVEQIHAVVLSGGSAFGLDSAGGVMDWLRGQGRGYSIAGQIVPIVPAAIIFDLNCGSTAGWKHPPWWQLGRKAAKSASAAFALGNSGAGLGATAGQLKGGLGSASCRTEEFTVGALAVANPVGSLTMPRSDTFWAWWLELEGEFGGQTPPGPLPGDAGPDDLLPGAATEPGANTTLVVVATDAALTRAQAGRVALMAQDGLARAIRPVHSPLDGDTVFVLSTARRPLADPLTGLARLGMIAADVTARAITRGVYEASSLAGYPAYRRQTED